MNNKKYCYNVISIKEESSFLIAIKDPRISYALIPLEGLDSTGVINTPLTKPKSNNLRLTFPSTI